MGRRDNRIKSLKRLAIGSSIAAATGYVVGVLTAPKSGKSTRNDIKQAADDRVADTEKELKKLHSELDKVIKEAKSGSGKVSKKTQKELSGIVEKAKDTKEKAREVIGAIKEGEAADKDLKRAIKDARAAIDHLKDYLKK